MIDLYSKWGNYIPNDLRKQFELEWLEVEEMLVKNNVALADVRLSLPSKEEAKEARIEYSGDSLDRVHWVNGYEWLLRWVGNEA